MNGKNYRDFLSQGQSARTVGLAPGPAVEADQDTYHAGDQHLLHGHDQSFAPIEADRASVKTDDPFQALAEGRIRID